MTDTSHPLAARGSALDGGAGVSGQVWSFSDRQDGPPHQCIQRGNHTTRCLASHCLHLETGMKSNLDFIHVTLASVVLAEMTWAGSGWRWMAVGSKVRWNPTRQRLFQVALPACPCTATHLRTPALLVPLQRLTPPSWRLQVHPSRSNFQEGVPDNCRVNPPIQQISNTTMTKPLSPTFPTPYFPATRALLY